MKVGGDKNFGYGKQIAYAAKNALSEQYASYNTVGTYVDRTKDFANYLKENGISDLREVGTDTLAAYGQALQERVESGQMPVATAQNQISAANQVMAAVRQDRAVAVSPSQAVGQRSQVRTEAPAMSREAVERAADQLREASHHRAAATAELARDLGLRSREAAQLPVHQAVQQARDTGYVSVTEGTKGGREADRHVPVSERAMQTLERAAEAAGRGHNLIPEGRTLKEFQDHVGTVWSPRAAAEGLGTIHDLRSAYACDRYEDRTGYPAPVVAGERGAPKATDQVARVWVSYELGHGRSDVAASYVGSAQ
jgi:integrase